MIAMVPRKKLDIGWIELARALLDCARPGNRQDVEARIAQAWGGNRDRTLVCLSVRSGFDLLLRALELPQGSEVLCSAITIPDMVQIIERHGLVPVPVDLDAATMGIRCDSLLKALNPRSKAVLVAHLFGSRMPLDPLFEVASRMGLQVWEDCAQAYVGPGFRGDSRSDVRMFSFGPIKTATALGGAILQFKAPELCRQAAQLRSRCAVQSRLQFLRRICKFMLVKALLYRWPMGAFWHACRVTGISHDRILARAGHSFPSSRLFRSIRLQPCCALLRLLERRISDPCPASVASRTTASCKLDQTLNGIERPGGRAVHHSHWLYPIWANGCNKALRRLWEAGFDATTGLGTLQVVQPPSGRPALTARAAQEIMQGLIFLPTASGLAQADIDRLSRLVLSLDLGEPRSGPRSHHESRAMAG